MALIRESSTTYAGESPSVTLTGGLSNALVIAIIKGDAGAERTLDAATLDGASADFMENLSTDSGRAISSAVYYWLNAKHPGAGAVTLATTWSAGINNVQMQVLEYSGANQTTTISTIATNVAGNQSDGATISSTLTGQTGELALSFEAQADSTAASMGGSLVPSVNLISLTGADVFAGQSRLAVGEDAIVASASEDYVWTVSQDGMTSIDSLVTGSFAIFAAADAGITVTVTLGTIDYTSQNTTVALTGSIDVTTTLGTISYSSQDATISLTGDIDVTATLGTIDYSSNNTTVSLSSEVIVSATLGAIDYTSHNATVLLSGLIDVTTTLGAIVYNSYPVTVQVGEGQVIGNVTVGFADDIYTAGFKPDTITVSFK